MSKRFTEGICGDGVAILDNGKQITITEILNNLNKLDELEQLRIGGVSCSCADKERQAYEQGWNDGASAAADDIFSRI